MPWNWELTDWPNFTYDMTKIASLDKKFLQNVGGSFALFKQLKKEEQTSFIVDRLCREGITSSAIEGEYLEWESLQSSLKKRLGLKHSKNTKVHAKEKGMADLLYAVYQEYQSPLTEQEICSWQEMIILADAGVEDRGKYRTHKEPMQIVSRKYSEQHIYFQAPPSSIIQKEMKLYIQWFNQVKSQESILARASILHLYFESIHPFEDGNGRIGRALVEKFLSQVVGHPTLIAISQEIEKKRKRYYEALGTCNRSLDATEWVEFFSHLILDAQKCTTAEIEFIFFKHDLMNRLQGTINSRQKKVLLRMFQEGPRGFRGGLSAENYLSITKTSRATATRDLVDLVSKGALQRTGEKRHTRYWL